MTHHEMFNKLMCRYGDMTETQAHTIADLYEDGYTWMHSFGEGSTVVMVHLDKRKCVIINSEGTIVEED